MSIWETRRGPLHDWCAPPLAEEVDVAIIGAGITGAFVAERMSRAGLRVAVFDKRAPQQGATAASTALVMWETDSPLAELEQRIGFEAAAAIWRRCFAAIGAMEKLAGAIGAAFEPRESLYLAGDMLDPDLLKLEAGLRQRAKLPCQWEDGETTSARDGVAANAALRSSGAGALDPIQFAHALLKAAQARGAAIYDGVAVTEVGPGEAGVLLRTSAGARVSAQRLVLATGYEMPTFVHGAGHRIDCTWAIAAPLERPLRPLVWEASRVYPYMRSAGTHVVIGGEDERGLSAEERGARTPAKSSQLTAKLRTLLPGVTPSPELAWSAFFGATEDGLPLIGPVRGAPRTFAAYGYGGNGITFSALAGELALKWVQGETDHIGRYFSLERF